MLREYNKITPEGIQELSELLGEKHVISGDPEKLEPYGFDVLALHHGKGHPPDVVVKPDSAGQIADIIKLANRENIPVTPRGAGSGLAGAAVPVSGGIVLSLERMNRILEIDKVDRVAVVEPGVITNDLCRQVERLGLMYAGYPMSSETSFIGGNVATNAGGGRVVRYGNTRRHILGLEVVLPTGEIIELGGRYRKSTWGYDLLNIMIGSEGTLGVFSKIFLNLIAARGETMDMLIPFPDTETAVRAVSEVIVAQGVVPETAEFMDRVCLTQSCNYHGINLPVGKDDDAGAYLIIQLRGDSREELNDLCEKAGETCMSQGALDVFVAVSPSQSKDIWKVREQFGEALNLIDPHVYHNSDIVVPFSKIPEIMRELKRLEEKHGTTILTVGHIADGNLHSSLLKPEGVALENWNQKAEEIFDEMTRIAIELGGVGSAEHGVGFLKKSIFLETKSKIELKLMRGIKNLFDPNNILNPGKVI
jgi:glycolate oxidase subunit GlcD